MEDFQRALRAIGLEQYAQQLFEEGFETWQQLHDITESDLEILGVRLGHRRRLHRAISDSRGHSSQDALGPVGGSKDFGQGQNIEITQSIDQSVDRSGHDQNPDRPPNAKRKYRRHPKADENAPERPPSAYVLFSHRVRERLKGQALSFSDIAKIVGEQWQDPDPDERSECERQAQEMKDEYYSRMTDYKKTPHYAAYNAYIAGFRAKHQDSKQQESKKSKAAPDFTTYSTRSTSPEDQQDHSAANDWTPGRPYDKRMSTFEDQDRVNENVHSETRSWRSTPYSGTHFRQASGPISSLETGLEPVPMSRSEQHSSSSFSSPRTDMQDSAGVARDKSHTGSAMGPIGVPFAPVQQHHPSQMRRPSTTSERPPSPLDARNRILPLPTNMYRGGSDSESGSARRPRPDFPRQSYTLPPMQPDARSAREAPLPKSSAHHHHQMTAAWASGSDDDHDTSMIVDRSRTPVQE